MLTRMQPTSRAGTCYIKVKGIFFLGMEPRDLMNTHASYPQVTTHFHSSQYHLPAVRGGNLASRIRQEVIVQHNPPAMTKNIFHQIRLLRSPSNLILNISRNGASITSLGNCSCSTSITVKTFLISNLNLPSCSVKPLPLIFT